MFNQSGGTSTISSTLYLGYNSGASGTYTLSGMGQMGALTEYVGYSGTGTFNHSGGTNTVSGSLYIGCNSGRSSAYTLNAGQLTASNEYVGYSGTASFNHNGGTNTVSGALYMGYNSGRASTYTLNTGQLTGSTEYVGYSGLATFNQSGGTNTVSSALYLGRNLGAFGTYTLSGTGQLNVPTEYIGFSGTGVFNHNGGTNTVAGAMYIGYIAGPLSTYTLSGTGQLSAGSMYVGWAGAGGLNIASAMARINVAGKMRFDANGRFTATTGSEIHMTGTAFANVSTVAANLAGLSSVTLICESGSANVVSMEVAGRDLGATAAGGTNNFLLHGLTLGGAGAGRISLVNNSINQPGWSGGEALYVDSLVMNPGAMIITNGLHLYYYGADGLRKQFFEGDANLDGAVDLSDLGILAGNYNKSGTAWSTGDFNGDGTVDLSDLGILAGKYGSTTQISALDQPVPEPATLSLLALGGLAMMRRQRK